MALAFPSLIKALLILFLDQKCWCFDDDDKGGHPALDRWTMATAFDRACLNETQ